MDRAHRTRRTLPGIAFCTVVLGLAGCSAFPTECWLGPTSPGDLPATLDRPKPTAESRKDEEAAREPESRSPARWKQKLRAKYV